MKKLTLAKIEKLEQLAALASVGPATLSLTHSGKVVSACSIDCLQNIVVNYTGNVSPDDL